MLLSTLLGTAGALGSAIYGAVASSKANNQARKLIQQQRDENKRWYDTKMNEDYTQRTDVQRAITKQRELLDEQLKKANARSIVGGASDEATALAKDSANKSVAEATADIAAAGADYKDKVEKEYRANDAALNQQQAQSYKEQAKESAAAAGQAVNAALGLVGMEGKEINLGKKAIANETGEPNIIHRNTDYTGLAGGGKETLPTSVPELMTKEQEEAARNAAKLKIPV